MKKIIYVLAASFLASTLMVTDSSMALAAKKADKPKKSDTIKEEAKNSEEIYVADDESAAKNDNAPATSEVSTQESGKKPYFSMQTKSRVDIASEERMKEKVFLKSISNEYFKIYEDEEDYTLVAKLPFDEKQVDYKMEFKSENLLVIIFKNKKNPEEKPVRYEINFPKPTTREAVKLLTRETLELKIPIDFFFDERQGRH